MDGCLTALGRKDEYNRKLSKFLFSAFRCILVRYLLLM